MQIVARGRLLGEGTYSRVYEVMIGEQKYALKHIPKGIGSSEQEYVKREVRVHSRQNHPNLCKVHSIYEDDTCYQLLLEHCWKRLDQELAQQPGGRFGAQEATPIVLQLARGLNVLHKKGISHRDLSLKKSYRVSQGSKRYVIADLGYVSQEKRNTTRLGKRQYQAIQFYEDGDYGKQVDVWALGVMAFLLIFGKYPFSGKNLKTDIISKCVAGFDLRSVVESIPDCRYKKAEATDKKWAFFFRGVFKINPQLRLTIEQLLHFMQSDLVSEQAVLKIYSDKIRMQEGSGLILMAGQGQESRRFRVRQLDNYFGCIYFIFHKAKQLNEVLPKLIPSALAKAFCLNLVKYFFANCKHLKLSFQNNQCPAQKFLQVWAASTPQSLAQAKITFENNYNEATQLFDLLLHESREGLAQIKKYLPSYQLADGFEEQFKQFKVQYRKISNCVYKQLKYKTQEQREQIYRLKATVFILHAANHVLENPEEQVHQIMSYKRTATRNGQAVFQVADISKWLENEEEEKLLAAVARLKLKYFG